MRIEGSRRGSVHTVQGFCVSMLPQTRQISIFSSAVASALASGAMICSRFLIRNSAARRAERGPSPGRRASSWIRRSISGPAAVGIACGAPSEQFQSWRQRQSAGDALHLLLQQRFGLAPRIGKSSNDEIFQDLLLLSFEEGVIDLDGLHVALAGQLDGDQA